MTVTTERPMSDVAVPPTPPRRARRPGRVGWSIAVLALLVTGAFVATVVRSDAPDTVTPAHSGIIEHGTPVAIDHAAEVEGAGTAGAGTVASATGGNHALIAEYGSPTAVDHAAQEARRD